MKFFITLAFIAISFTGFAQTELPNLDLENLQGRDVNLKQIDSKKSPIIVSLWATWCVPCLKELDAINSLYSGWQEETGVELYAISMDDSRTVNRVRPLVNGKGWDYNILLDPNNDLKRRLGAATVPLTMIVKDGKIVYRHSGYAPGAEDELYEELKKAAN
jgi:thiol-disulfide isomerase/thioredoxin